MKVTAKEATADGTMEGQLAATVQHVSHTATHTQLIRGGLYSGSTQRW